MAEGKTLSDYQKAIEASLEDISNITYNADLMGAQQARVQLELRTFATGGSGVKDIAGKGLSKYSKSYAKRREKAGLQSANKDLIFNKNTSVIKDNITLGTSDGKPALGFLKEEGARIAGYQEEREKTVIFAINDSDKQKIVEQVKKYIMDASQKIVQGWNK